MSGYSEADERADLAYLVGVRHGRASLAAELLSDEVVERATPQFARAVDAATYGGEFAYSDEQILRAAITAALEDQ